MHTEHLQYYSLIHLAKFTSYEATRILYLPSWPRRQTLKQANYYITISRSIKKYVTLWDQPATFLKSKVFSDAVSGGNIQGKRRSFNERLFLHTNVGSLSKKNFPNMGSVPVNKISDHYELTCGICKETYKNPKVLPCLHSFCQNCLDSSIR